MNTLPHSDPPALDKVPRTDRGRVTMRKLLDAAAAEFGDKGFHEASITGITSRAGTALGTFYTYFNSKDEIFQALVSDLSGQVRQFAAQAVAEDMTGLQTERVALSAFLEFARAHKEIYRIIDESEFVDPESHRRHYETTASRILSRLQKGSNNGEFRSDLEEAHAWAIMGMNVFLGLKYCIWSDELSIDQVTDVAGSILREGISAAGE